METNDKEQESEKRYSDYLKSLTPSDITFRYYMGHITIYNDHYCIVLHSLGVDKDEFHIESGFYKSNEEKFRFTYDEIIRIFRCFEQCRRNY